MQICEPCQIHQNYELDFRLIFSVHFFYYQEYQLFRPTNLKNTLILGPESQNERYFQCIVSQYCILPTYRGVLRYFVFEDDVTINLVTTVTLSADTILIFFEYLCKGI